MNTMPSIIAHEGQTFSEGAKPERVRIEGSVLKRMRLERSYTQAELADKAGIAQATLRHLETGQMQFLKTEIALRIAAVLEQP